MRAPLPLLALAALLALAGCVVVDDTRPAVGGVTGPADPGAYLKPVAKPTPATRDPGVVAGNDAALGPAATPAPVDPDPEAPTGEEPEEDGEEPAEDEEAGGV